MDIPKHWKLYQYETLINCAIMAIHKHWWMMPLWDTNEPCNYGHVYKHYAVLWLWILTTHRSSKDTRISPEFGNIYGQYAYKYTWAQLSKMTYTLSSLVSYKWLSCRIIKSTVSKGVNKYMQLIIPTIVLLWHDSTPQSKLSLVYIVCFHWSVSRWGNGEPGN